MEFFEIISTNNEYYYYTNAYHFHDLTVKNFRISNKKHNLIHFFRFIYYNKFFIRRYAFLSRRCITKEECYEMEAFSKKHPWRPFKGSCVTQCPDGFEDGVDAKNVSEDPLYLIIMHFAFCLKFFSCDFLLYFLLLLFLFFLFALQATTCQRCKGQCPKISNGAVIRHMSDAQNFRGIKIVEGGLEFQIRNGNPNIMNELADAFGLIEVITGNLKISRSFSITSLNFFKKLKVIKGEELDYNNASLILLDNPNLSSLFAPNQKIKIESGRLFFDKNPKLCMYKIEQFAEMVNMRNFTDLEVQPDSNGDKVACNIVNINITVQNRSADHVLLIWDSYKPPEDQQLLSYLLSYIETENENITYDMSACGNNTWQIVDVDIPNRNLNVSKHIRNLKPYTKYAAYVKTFTARNKTSFASPVGQSQIIFFRTMSTIPSPPTNVISTALSDSEILLKWDPPVYPNGPIEYYIISGTIRLDDKELIASRDYCINMLVNEADYETVEQITIKAPPLNPNSCCSKDTNDKNDISKHFQIFCHKNITISHLSSGWKDNCMLTHDNYPESEFYDLAINLSFLLANEKQEAVTNSPMDPHVQISDRRRIAEKFDQIFMYNVSSRNNSYILKNLHHYSLYTIKIAACGMETEDNLPMCSSVQYANTRTKKKLNADDVDNLKVHVNNNTIVEIFWNSVKNPNAFTVSYSIEYTNLDIKDARKSIDCIPYTGRNEKHNTHYIKNLSPGRYSLRIRSTSLAGDGAFSNMIYFSIGLSESNSMILLTLLTCGILCISFIMVFLLFKHYQRKKTQERLIASVNPDYIETRYIVDSWEVPRENVEIQEELGLGNFGMVYRGSLNGTIQVAIKTISETASQREKNEFLNEASVMKNFLTFHIIKLLGVVSIGNPPFVIMELMENGDLKTYLREIRDTDLIPDASRIMKMAAEIADGMAYLESKKFVHRDLAARNCMVSENLVCKIGDFGMARDIYETDYYKIGKKGLLPIRWMAPESLSDGVFTSDSDVWSFGIVLYEILTLAEIPYQGFSNEEVLNHVLRKGMLNIPRNCPENVQKIMEKCFKWRPSDRPTFMEIVTEFEPFLGQDFGENSFYHSEEGVEIRNLGIKKVYHHAAPIRFHWGNETARWVKDFEDNVTLLDQNKASTSRGRIFKSSFQQFGNVINIEDDQPDQ